MDNHTTPRTPQETALIAAHATRAAALSQQMTLILLRSLTREAEQQPGLRPFRARAHQPQHQPERAA